jgi:hypothetical protein
MTQKTTRTVYKAVRRKIHNGRVQYTSVLAIGKAEVCYKVGEYVEAPDWLARRGYHLFVFDSLDDAINAFPYTQSVFELWEAEAQGVREPRDIPGMCFSKLAEGVFKPSGMSLGGKGVLLAKRVKLVRKVHPRT